MRPVAAWFSTARCFSFFPQGQKEEIKVEGQMGVELGLPDEAAV